MRFEGSNVIIPTPGKPIVIPTYTYHSNALGRSIPLIAAVPWFGTRNWETMYDWPAHLDTAAHISIAAVWDICAIRQVIASNAGTIDLAIDNILDNQRPDQIALDPDLAKKYAAARPDPQDIYARENMAELTLKNLKDSGWQEMFAQTADKDLKPDERIQKLLLNDAVNALTVTVSRNHHLHGQVETKRQWLASQITGKGVLVGFTATGVVDQVSTSLHLHCPGIVVHGVIVNAVLTNSWWKVLPEWVTVFITILLGMSAATIQGRFQPLRASFFIFAILLGYLLINGYILFDWHKWIVGVASPSVVVLVVWIGTTLDRVIVEGHERNRIALENAVISKEMDLARQVQVALIPTRAPKSSESNPKAGHLPPASPAVTVTISGN